MTNEWMLDVLADLKTFAADNGLDFTAKQLDLLMAVAAAEMASIQGIAQGAAQRGIDYAGGHYRETAKRQDA